LGDKVSDAFSGSVCPMSAAESIVYIDVAKVGELSREVGVIGLFSGVEAQIFEQQYLARFELARHLGGYIPHAVRGKGDVDRFTQRVVEQGAQAVDDRPQAVFGIRLSLRTTQVRSDNYFGVSC